MKNTLYLIIIIAILIISCEKENNDNDKLNKKDNLFTFVAENTKIDLSKNVILDYSGGSYSIESFSRDTSFIFTLNSIEPNKWENPGNYSGIMLYEIGIYPNLKQYSTSLGKSTCVIEIINNDTINNYIEGKFSSHLGIFLPEHDSVGYLDLTNGEFLVSFDKE